MDALCINQEDQGNSQNQVTTMRETYQDASIIDRELWNAKMPTDRPPSDPETTGSDIRIHNAPHLECLTAVCQHAAQILKEQHGINTTDNLSAQVVVRVPAVWSFFARKGALQAVQQAFPTLECTMSRISKAETTAEPISSSYEDIDNSAFIVCDAGGGTCDVVSYDVQKLQPYLKLGEDTRTMSGCRSPHSLGVSFDHNQHHGLGCMFTDKDITRHVRSDLPELGDGRNVHGIRIKTDTISTCVRRDQDIPSVPKDQAVKYGHRGRLWNSDPNSVKPLEYSRDFSNFYKRTLYSFVDSAFITTLLHSMRDLVVRLSKGFSVADANCPLSCSWCWTCRPTLRRITKSSIISLSLVANVIIMMYGFEHGINLPQSSAWSSSWASKTNVCLMQDYLSRILTDSQVFAVHWILHPPSLLFFVTCIVLAWLLAYYFELNELHRHQAHILVAGLLIWPLTAVIVACSVLASIFHILPWTVWISFVISEIIHYFLPEDRKILVFLSFSAHTKKECLPEAHELDEGKAEADIDERCNDLDSHRPSRRQGTCHTYKNVTKD